MINDIATTNILLILIIIGKIFYWLRSTKRFRVYTKWINALPRKIKNMLSNIIA